ncbi:MAG: PIN domain-containing protein [Dehalococcoidia bacterium]
MKYLFDTDVLSELLRRAPRSQLIRRLAGVAIEDQATSSITVGELIYGAHRLGQRGHDLVDRIERTLLANLLLLAFDALAARVYGELRASLEREGRPIGDADTRIAAIALARDLVVVTGNVRHFASIDGLRVENWLD